MERTRAALVDYAEVIRREGAERVRMVATSATRDARNREDFFCMVQDTLGIDAEVISGDEEATLSFVGAVGDLDPDDGPFVVVDVGGGSTELVVGTLEGGKATVQAARSVDVGSVRLTERCLAGDPPSEDEVAEACRVATGILDEAFDAVSVEGVRTWVGVAGTITTLRPSLSAWRSTTPRRCTTRGWPTRTCTGWRASCWACPARSARATAPSTPAGST